MLNQYFTKFISNIKLNLSHKTLQDFKKKFVDSGSQREIWIIFFSFEQEIAQNSEIQIPRIEVYKVTLLFKGNT